MSNLDISAIQHDRNEEGGVSRKHEQEVARSNRVAPIRGLP
jgi:hypothetical protein